jgi:sugar-specific transcriptional regulator TrmB
MSLAETLVPFGFTALESEVYVYLLRESPATGYRIAHGINKPAANTYKAIQTLQAKGAILVEEGSTRSCRAVPLSELMNRLQKDFESRRKDAEKKLRTMDKPVEDERIYQLRSRDQILNKVREMLASSKSVAVMKLPEFAFHAVEGDIENAAERGIEVSVVTSATASLPSADVAHAVEQHPGSTLCVVDGSQSLAGVLSPEGSSEAFWTQNPSLAKVLHGSASAEVAFAHVAAMLANDEKRSRMIRAAESRRGLPQNLSE